MTTEAAGGDIDATCAIVGGITAAGAEPGRLPAAWLRVAEPLPSGSVPHSDNTSNFPFPGTTGVVVAISMPLVLRNENFAAW